MTHEHFMQQAINEAKKGDFAYGAVIVKDGKIVARGRNSVLKKNDPTEHGEINAIRKLTRANKNPSLKGYTLYTTCEPCPMCVSACIWAGVSKIVYGVSIKDILNLGDYQINVPCERVIDKGFNKIQIIKGVLKNECMKLYQK